MSMTLPFERLFRNMRNLDYHRRSTIVLVGRLVYSDMKLNPSKTKELFVNFSTNPPTVPPIITDHKVVEVVKEVKLLGVWISSDFKWNKNIDEITKKASKRLFSLSLLKRSGIPLAVLLSIYCTCIRPIMEYACEVWHHSLPVYLGLQLQHVQKRALRITQFRNQRTFLHYMTAEINSANVRSTKCLILATK